jgi:sigma-B regulation protein RsbU (phosphoserine phosphatase)
MAAISLSSAKPLMELMPAVRIALRTNVSPAIRVELTIEMANRVMYELTDEERFVSLFYGVLDITSRHLCSANAGHHPPLLFRAHSREAGWLETGGPRLGLVVRCPFREWFKGSAAR